MRAIHPLAATVNSDKTHHYAIEFVVESCWGRLLSLSARLSDRAFSKFLVFAISLQSASYVLAHLLNALLGWRHGTAQVTFVFAPQNCVCCCIGKMFIVLSLFFFKHAPYPQEGRWLWIFTPPFVGIYTNYEQQDCAAGLCLIDIRELYLFSEHTSSLLMFWKQVWRKKVLFIYSFFLQIVSFQNLTDSYSFSSVS